jgi:putative DNA primase/helicase
MTTPPAADRVEVALAIALGHIRRGRAPVPIPHRHKGPVLKGWRNLRITEVDAPSYFNGGPLNIGVRLGSDSGGLNDVDLDCPEAIELAPYLLPPTESSFGRESKPRSHLLYLSEEGRLVQLVDPENGETLVELRRDGGHQTIFPGSTHPSGEAIEWAEDGDPPWVDPRQLEAAVKRLGAGCLLQRAGWDLAQVRRFVSGADRLDHADLVGSIGEKRARKVAEWLGLGASEKPEDGASFSWPFEAATRAEPPASREDLEALADAILNDNAPWDEWNSVGLGFHAASGGAEDGFAAWDRWSRKSSKHDSDTTEKRWKHFYRSPPTITDIRPLIARAQNANPDFRLPSWGEGKPGDAGATGTRGDGAEAPAAETGDALFDTSHDGLALDMGRRWTDARHVALWGQWLFYTGSRWERDERLLHLTRTRDFLRRKADELVRWAQDEVAKGDESDGIVKACEAMAKSLRSAQTVANVVGLARSNPAQAATVGQWDADPWLLGTPGGTVDLRTGALRSAKPGDYITRQTAVAPAPPGTPAPLWAAFLKRTFEHDPELVPYMRRVAGYALTGQTSEHALVFAWGQGGNGKGVFFNTLAHVLADYAAVAAPDLLLVTNSDRHPTDMAMLRAARLVIASEVAPGRAWDEPKLKSLTGGDPITARFMRQDFFTYTPQFTLLVAGNHKPAFKSVDEAVRRRVHLVPFLQNIPKEERDPELGEKLKAEAPAILRWAIDGCLDWQRQGLNPPQTVREASESYLEGEDVLGQWIAERCELGGSEITNFDVLFTDWQQWCQANGGPGWGGKTFSKALDERGFARGKSGLLRGFRGIRLRPKTEKPKDGMDFNDAKPQWEGRL